MPSFSRPGSGQILTPGPGALLYNGRRPTGSEPDIPGAIPAIPPMGQEKTANQRASSGPPRLCRSGGDRGRRRPSHCWAGLPETERDSGGSHVQAVAEHSLDKVVVAGTGEGLIAEAAAFLGMECVRISERYGREISDVFPAYAVLGWGRSENLLESYF